MLFKYPTSENIDEDIYTGAHTHSSHFLGELWLVAALMYNITIVPNLCVLFIPSLMPAASKS